MIPYIILFIILLWGGYYELKNLVSFKLGDNYKISSKAVYALLPIIMILFIGVFREITVGYDSEQYYIYFWLQKDKFSWTDLLTNFSVDNGFWFLLKLISLFTNDWWIARAILFTITFILYYSALIKETPYINMSLIIFFGLSTMGLMLGILRQALSCAVCIHAYRKIKKGSWLKCLILILIAATIHKTALLCLLMIPVYFLWKKQFSWIKILLLSILSGCVFYVGIPIVTVLYADSRYSDIAVSEGGYGMLLFFLGVIVLMFYLMHITQANQNDELCFLFNLSSIAIFIQIGALQWGLLNRTTSFFSIYWCILIPKLINRMPHKLRGQYYLLVAILFGFMFFYQLSEVDMFVMHQF